MHQDLSGFVAREIAGISRIDTLLPHVTPDYVAMLHDIKMAKQANVEQMATLVRMAAATPDERGGIRRMLTRAQAAVASRVSVNQSLRSMRGGEVELVSMYAESVREAQGLVKRALRKLLGRALVHAHLLAAHLARRTGTRADAAVLPVPLDDYFCGDEARACMRCHLDRRGSAGSLERNDPHPYTYICAACHDEVLGEFAPDLAAQIDRWPQAVREARVIQKALGHVSKLNAIGRILHPLAGLEPELPTPAADRAVIVPAMTPTPGPAPGERPGELVFETGEGLEGEYVRTLFSPPRTRRNW
jgi:hypothetical protein